MYKWDKLLQSAWIKKMYVDFEWTILIKVNTSNKEIHFPLTWNATKSELRKKNQDECP